MAIIKTIIVLETNPSRDLSMKQVSDLFKEDFGYFGSKEMSKCLIDDDHLLFVSSKSQVLF